MEITGRIKTVLPLQQGTSQRGPWSKAIIVIEYQSGNYTNILALENMGKAAEFAALPVGAEFKFWFDPVSREHQGRYYTQCNCFNWQAVGQQQQQQYQQPQGYVPPQPPQGYTPAAQQNCPPQPAPGYPQPPQGYAPQAPGYAPAPGGVVDGDCPY